MTRLIAFLSGFLATLIMGIVVPLAPRGDAINESAKSSEIEIFVIGGTEPTRSGPTF